jgi:hypothetical protein
MASDDQDEGEKTPILLHPQKRAEFLNRGQELFNDEKFFEAHEVWEDLWKLEYGKDKTFLQGLIQAAGHFVHLQKGNWSGALSVGEAARAKLIIPASYSQYRALDVAPLVSAIEYNNRMLGPLARSPSGPRRLDAIAPPPPPEAFLFPKLF